MASYQVAAAFQVAYNVTMNIESAVQSRSRASYRHSYLLVCLLLDIGVSPFLPTDGDWLLEGLLFATLVAGAYATTKSRKQLLLFGLLASLSVVLHLLYVYSSAEGTLLRVFLYGFLSCYAVTFSLIAITLVRSLIATRGQAIGQTLCGAASVYLLLGLVWVMAYSILELAEPGSFNFGIGGTAEPDHFERFLGFSFTTLTTLGYGNVAPTTPQADALTTMEALTGQFYLAVVFARLVALSIMGGRSETSEE